MAADLFRIIDEGPGDFIFRPFRNGPNDHLSRVPSGPVDHAKCHLLLLENIKVLDVESVAIFGELFSQIRFPKSELVQMVFEFAISISAVVRIGDPFVDLVPEGIGERNAVLFIRSEEHTSELQSLMRKSY